MRIQAVVEERKSPTLGGIEYVPLNTLTGDSQATAAGSHHSLLGFGYHRSLPSPESIITVGHIMRKMLVSQKVV
jgi:hypothetical protein